MKIKEITNEELDALVKEGHDIVHAIIAQDKYTPKLTGEEEVRMATIQRRNPLIKTVRQLSDEEWERLGIARYVTWPRTVCSIEGHDVKGQPL